MSNEPQLEVDEFGRPTPTAYLKYFSVSELFGYKEIELDLQSPRSSEERPINIIYGSNGSGKTTALKLIYFFLSPQDGRSYKSWIAKLPFKTAKFEFSDGRKLRITKEHPVGSFIVEHRYKNKKREYNIIYRDGGVKKSYEETDVMELLSLLDSLPFDLFYISDSRQYFTTSNYINKSSPRLRRRRDLTSEVALNIDDLESNEEKSITISAMSEIITEVFRRRVLRTGASSQRNTNSIYKDLVRSVIDSGNNPVGSGSKEGLLQQIGVTASKSAPAVSIGAMPSFDEKFYRASVVNANDDTLEKLNLIISPFLNSTNARADAINPLVKRMDALVLELNRFYGNKKFSFTLSTGFGILSEDTGLPVKFEWLSSGERQLFIILSSVFLTYEANGIVLIDEPELSLNIIWQREFVQALQRITEGSPVQYILASHSPEILSSEAAHVISSGK